MILVNIFQSCIMQNNERISFIRKKKGIMLYYTVRALGKQVKKQSCSYYILLSSQEALHCFEITYSSWNTAVKRMFCLRDYPLSFLLRTIKMRFISLILGDMRDGKIPHTKCLIWVNISCMVMISTLENTKWNLE